MEKQVIMDMEEMPRVNPEFQKKMKKYSKNFMTVHALISSLGAISYSIVIIMATNVWSAGIETMGWHISGGYLANTILANLLAVIVNLNLCFAALLVLGVHKDHRGFVKLWCLGQFMTCSGTLIIILLSVVYDCKLAALFSIPPFLYYSITLSFTRQIMASISIQNTDAQ